MPPSAAQGTTLQGYACAACNNIETAEGAVLVSVLYSRHRGAVIGAIATLSLGVLVGPFWTSTETQHREKIESTRLRHDREEKVMTQFAEFRTALTQLATDCVPRALSEESSAPAPSTAHLSKCSELYGKVISGYTHWAWIFHIFAKDIRDSDTCSARDPASGEYVAAACRFFTCTTPMRAITCTYNAFANAYAAYVAGKTDDIEKLRDATHKFFILTRRVGCMTVIAGYRNTPTDRYEDTTGTCIDFMKPLPNTNQAKDAWCASVADIDQYCPKPAEPPGTKVEQALIRPPLDIEEWFRAPPRRPAAAPEPQQRRIVPQLGSAQRQLHLPK